MRELLLRHEKATDLMFRRFDAVTDEMRARTEEIRAGTEEIRAGTDATSEAIRAHTREFVAEMRAQRQALFRMLDRFDNGGGASAGA